MLSFVLNVSGQQTAKSTL